MKLTPPQSTTNAPASEIISRVGDAGNQFFLEVWGVAELYLVDDELVIIDPDLMTDLDDDLNAFLENLLKD